MTATGKYKASQYRRVKIYRDWCKRCGICTAFCPKEILPTDKDGYPYLKDAQECTGCGLCELMCPDFALVMEDEQG